MTLLELATDFGVKESCGELLTVPFGHQDIADLVSASRPRVTEQLAQLAHEQLIIRQSRQLIACVDKIKLATGAAAPSISGRAFINTRGSTASVRKQHIRLGRKFHRDIGRRAFARSHPVERRRA
jgi:hypothetical protein